MSEPTPSLKDAIEKLMGLYLAPSRFREPIKSAIEAHNSELDETITMLKALEAQSLEGLRAKVEAAFSTYTTKDAIKRDILSAISEIDTKPTEDKPT